MYGLSVTIHVDPGCPFAAVLAQARALEGFIEPKGLRVAQVPDQPRGRSSEGVHGVGEVGFKAPLFMGEVRSGPLPFTRLDQPSLLWPEVPAPGRWWIRSSCEVRLRVRPGDSPDAHAPLFREILPDGTLMRVLLLSVGSCPIGHSINFWSESHVWLGKAPENPLREYGDDNLLALAIAADDICKALRNHVDDVSGPGQSKGPFFDERERLAAAFEHLPRFKRDY